MHLSQGKMYTLRKVKFLMIKQIVGEGCKCKC